MAWHKTKYSISQATGGGKVYTWSTSNEDLAVVDSEGKVNTHSGPGSIKVKAAMAKAPQNFDEVSVSNFEKNNTGIRLVSR